LKILLRTLLSKITLSLLLCGSPIAAMDIFKIEDLLKFEEDQNSLKKDAQSQTFSIPDKILSQSSEIENGKFQKNVKFVPKKKVTPPAPHKPLAKKITPEEQKLLNEKIVATTDYASVLDLINKGANVNARNKKSCNETPLHNATNQQKFKTVELLLEHGADVNATNGEEKTALHLCCEQNNYEIAELLIKHHANVNIEDQDDKTALLLCCEKKCFKIAELLIKHHANVNLTYTNDKTALHLCCEQNNYTMAQLLIEHGANVNSTYSNGKTALLICCENKRFKIAKLLIKHNADVNAKYENGQTALHFCCKNDNPEMVELLINHGANVNAKYKKGKTTLYCSSHNSSAKITELLIMHGAKIDSKDQDGKTPLYRNIENNNTEIAKLLIEHGANVNLAYTNDGNNKTALHLCCEQNNYKIAELLIKHGADVNLKDQDNKTAFHLCCERNNFSLAELLIKHDAQADITDLTLCCTQRNEYPETLIKTLKYVLERNANFFSLNKKCDITEGYKVALNRLKTWPPESLDHLCKSLIPVKKQTSPQRTSHFITFCVSSLAEQLQQGKLPLTVPPTDTIIKGMLETIPDAANLIKLIELAMNYYFLKADQQPLVSTTMPCHKLSEKQYQLALKWLDCEAFQVLKILTDHKELRGFLNNLFKTTQKKAQLKAKNHCFSDLKIYFKDPRYI